MTELLLFSSFFNTALRL